MAAKNPTYDLILMLDTGAPDEQRAKVLADVERIIGAGGEVAGKQEWGARATAYEIRHKADAEYHLIQFHATPEVLRTLDRTLRITDGIVRFRIIKLAPGTPPPPEVRPEPRPAAAGASTDDAVAPAAGAEQRAEAAVPAAPAPAEAAPAESAPAEAAAPGAEPAPEEPAEAPADAEAPTPAT
jgi:small subunit ribosomal protein S6